MEPNNKKKTSLRSEDFDEILPEDSFNGRYTALPKDAHSADEVSADPDLGASRMDFGAMNPRDAELSGYTKKGHAVSKARPDNVGSPTGAYTDVGRGHSSAVARSTSASKGK